MRAAEIIADNLDAWMKTTPGLETIEKVAARSRVGFGTVRRVRAGTGNPTIGNLADIAAAFGRRVEDLLEPPRVGDTATGYKGHEARSPLPPAYGSLAEELVAVAETMSVRGQIELIGRAKELARQYPAGTAESSF